MRKRAVPWAQRLRELSSRKFRQKQQAEALLISGLRASLLPALTLPSALLAPRRRAWIVPSTLRFFVLRSLAARPACPGHRPSPAKPVPPELLLRRPEALRKPTVRLPLLER